MKREFWTTERDRSKSWHARLRFGRWDVGWHIHRHSGVLPDRWVFQPYVIVDRRSGIRSQD